MALWSNTDANTSAPKYAVAGGLGVSANGEVLYGNTTPDAFVTGIELGVFGISPNETVGTGNVSSIAVTDAGGSAFGLPAVTITGANTTQATATLNVKVTSIDIVTQGSGYAVGNTFFVHTGANTTTGVLTVATIGSIGNVTSINITTAGKYSTVSGANNNAFAANTGSGTGFTANVRFGIESVTVNAAGEDYNQGTVGAVFTANGITGATASVTLDGQEATNRGAHAGWVIRKEGSGGRAGRVQLETLVAMGSMTGDGADDTQFAEVGNDE
jgi:hypothetical protein